MINTNNIRAEMIRKDKSIKELSKELNKSYSTISQKLNGRIKFTADELGIIAKILNVDINMFYK